MTSVKQLAWFKYVGRVAAILVFLVPTSALAWYCGGTGYMTGGGKLEQCTTSSSTCVDISGGTFSSSGVTNGYELHCTGDLPNNLEINDHLSNSFKFKLETLKTANCFNDGFSPTPPTAGFDVFEGQGNGTWSSGNNTNISACAEWAFADHGSGHASESYIRITDTPSTTTDFCPLGKSTSPMSCPGAVLLLVPYGPLLKGTNQAHK